MKTLTALLLLAVSALSGCASVLQDEEATIAFAAPGCPEETECTLRNKKGSWSLMVPGTITIPKSDDTLHVTCRTPDGRRHSAAMESKFGGSFWGNVILGGGIGMIVDANTDAHRHYDTSIVLDFCR